MTAYAPIDSVSVNNFPAVQTVTGSVAVTGITLTGTINFPSTMVVTGSGPFVVAGSDNGGVDRVLRTDTAGAVFVTSSGSLPVTTTPASVMTSNVTVITASLTNQIILTPTAGRLTTLFTNDDYSSGSVYLKFGSNASTGSYSVKLRAGAYYEVTFPYAGRIDGIWDTAIGSLFITELSS